MPLEFPWPSPPRTSSRGGGTPLAEFPHSASLFFSLSANRDESALDFLEGGFGAVVAVKPRDAVEIGELSVGRLFTADQEKLQGGVIARKIADGGLGHITR